eukprot:1162021-Pelagomonas_calceolata.AAC.3
MGARTLGLSGFHTAEQVGETFWFRAPIREANALTTEVAAGRSMHHRSKLCMHWFGFDVPVAILNFIKKAIKLNACEHAGMLFNK